MPFRVVALSCALLALSPAWAVAQPSGSMVRSWTVPGPACGDSARLDAEVARLLGGDPDGRRHAVRVSGAITAAADGRLSLSLEIEDTVGQPLGSRVLSAGECAPLAEAAALLVALAIDPGAVAEAGTEGAAPELPAAVELEGGAALDAPVGSDAGSDSDADSDSDSGSGSDAESEVRAPSSELREPIAASEVREPSSEDRGPSSDSPAHWPTTFAMEGSLFLELGTLPAPAAGIALGARMRRRRLRLALSAAALFPREATVGRATGPAATARFFGLMARLELGGGFRRGIVHFDAGAVLDVAVLSGASDGISDPDRGAAALALVGGLARVLVRVGRVAIGLEGDLRVPTSRPRFEILGLGAAHRPSALVGRVGVVLRFPARP